MSQIETFFEAWGMAEPEARKAAIESAVENDIVYADPRSPSPITGAAALADYVGMFSQAAPGARAVVVKSDVTGEMARVTVAFRMADGMEQLGQYFIEPATGPILRMTGFVGTGAPE